MSKPEQPSEPAIEHRQDAGELDQPVFDPSDTSTVMLVGLFMLAFLAALYVGKPVFMPMVLAVLLAVMLRYAVRWMRDALRVPSPVGAALVLLAIVGGLGTATYFLMEPAAIWLEEMPEKMREIEEKFRGLRENVRGLQEAGEEVESLTKGEQDLDDPVEVRVREARVAPFLLGQTWYVAANSFLTLGLVYFLLAADDLFLLKLVRVLPRMRNKKLAVDIVHRVYGDIARYFFVITIINAGLGVAIGLAMWALGVPSPLLWGIAGALLNFIPFGGAIVGVLAVAVVAAANFENPGYILLVPAVYYTLTTIEGSFVTPMILGQRLVLNPVVIFLSIILWGWLWGIPGIFLAVPIMSAIKITCDNIDPLKAIGEFLGR